MKDFKMKKPLYFLLITVSCFYFSACATIFSGTSDRITFESKPDGAKVYIDGLDEGTTPTTIRVSRNFMEVDVSLKLDGYEPYNFKLKKEFNWVSILNLGDPLGWAIDIASGAFFKYRPRGYTLELEPKKK